ncbi:hypothetical protein MMC10_000716 [Thelotrema lepadinum]|nr:hypothetical protein [Thelotrema lepadinum]
MESSGSTNHLSLLENLDVSFADSQPDIDNNGIPESSAPNVTTVPDQGATTVSQQLEIPTVDNGNHSNHDKVVSILSLPYELLQIIIEDTKLTVEDKFAFKLANRKFLYLKPEWDTLKSKFSSESKYQLARRLNRILAASYLCSACRTRHDAQFFSTAEQEKADSDRKCIGTTGGVAIFENMLLTTEGVQKFLRDRAALPSHHNLSESFLLNRGDHNFQGIAIAGCWKVKNPARLCIDSDQGRTNHVQYHLRLLKNDRGISVVSSANIYFPWLDFFIVIAQHADPSDLGLQTAWYHNSRPWNIPLCEHRDLSDSRICTRLAREIRGWRDELGETLRYKISFKCTTCSCRITVHIGKERSGTLLLVRTDRYLGPGDDPCDQHWIRQIHKADDRRFDFGEKWNMRGPRTPFLLSMVSE